MMNAIPEAKQGIPIPGDTAVSLKLAVALVFLLLPAPAFCWSKQMDFDCGELAPGASQSYLQTFPVRNKFVAQIAVAVEASNIGSEKAPKCRIKWTVRGTTAGRTSVLFRHTDEPEHTLNGVSFEGTSPDGSKLLLDFFAAEGERTLHRPVVYDFLSHNWQIRDVGDQVARNLPATCNYLTMISGVTNQGDVVLYVPKSLSDKSCPDQGEWLLSMSAGTVTRVDAHPAQDAPASLPQR
jgi:hypothetical protein